MIGFGGDLPSSTADWIVLGGSVLAIAIYSLFVARPAARKRKKAIAAARMYWRRERPDTLLAACPNCRIPFPADMRICPMCEVSRIRGRVLKRDRDWPRDTDSGYGGL